MSFNPDVNKQAQEVIYSRKIKSNIHPLLVFNNNIVSQANSQKHLGITLDFKLTFQEQLLNVIKKVNKTIGLLSKLKNLLPRTTLITIYKAFIRPHLDYGDILYDQAFNSSSVKWGHLAHLEPNSTHKIFSTNPMGSSSPL